MSRIARLLVVDWDDPTYDLDVHLFAIHRVGYKKAFVLDGVHIFPYIKDKEEVYALMREWFINGLGKDFYHDLGHIQNGIWLGKWRTMKYLIRKVGEDLW